VLHTPPHPPTPHTHTQSHDCCAASWTMKTTVDVMQLPLTKFSKRQRGFHNHRSGTKRVLSMAAAWDARRPHCARCSPPHRRAHHHDGGGREGGRDLKPFNAPPAPKIHPNHIAICFAVVSAALFCEPDRQTPVRVSQRVVDTGSHRRCNSPGSNSHEAARHYHVRSLASSCCLHRADQNTSPEPCDCTTELNQPTQGCTSTSAVVSTN